MGDKLNELADGGHCEESHRRGEALMLDCMHNVEPLLMNDGEQEKEPHNPSHEECDHDDDDLYDDEFDEDLALEEVWV